MDYYRTYYNLVFIEIHSSPESLGKYFHFDSEGNLTEIYWGPKSEECNIAKIFFTSIDFMTIICKYLYDYFEIPKKEEIDNFIKKSDVLYKKYIDKIYKDKGLIKWVKILRKND